MATTPTTTITMILWQYPLWSMEFARRPIIAFTGAREHPADLGEPRIGLSLGPGRSSEGRGGFPLEEGVSPPAPMRLSTGLSTPPAPTNFESLHELRQGWGVKNRTSRGRDNSRGRSLRSAHELAHPQGDVAVDHIAQHAMRCRDQQHTVCSC